MRRMRAVALMLALAAALAVASMACDEREPQEHLFNLELRGGELVQDTSKWEVKQDDRVTMVVRSDEPVSFHLHGYDFEKDIEPGEPAEFAFTANATGSFPITIHLGAPGADDHDAGHAAGIEAPEGMTVTVEAEPDSVSGINVSLSTTEFTFAPEESGGEHVAGHGHAHLYVDGVKVGRPYGAHYHVSSVGPGEHTVRATLNTNTHAEYTVGGRVVEDTITIVVPDAAASSGGHGHGDDGGDSVVTVEKELGRFEVQP